MLSFKHCELQVCPSRYTKRNLGISQSQQQSRAANVYTNAFCYTEAVISVISDFSEDPTSKQQMVDSDSGDTSYIMHVNHTGNQLLGMVSKWNEDLNVHVFCFACCLLLLSG